MFETILAVLLIIFLIISAFVAISCCVISGNIEHHDNKDLDYQFESLREYNHLTSK